MSEAQDRPKRPKNLVRHFLIVNFLYLLVVHLWCIGAHPVGKDFERLAEPGSQAAAFIIGVEKTLLGGFAPAYHLVNIALLYGCMVATFFLTRQTVGGQVWMGSLAATMLMANPLKSEATLQVTGILDLLPALLVLAALALYAAHGNGKNPRRALAAIGCFSIAVFLSERYLPLIIPVLLLEVLFVRHGNRCVRRLAPYVVAAVAAAVFHARFGEPQWPGFAQVFGPLCLVWYPIGLLPGTADFYSELPLAGWLAGAITVAVFAFVARKARQRAVLFGLLSMAAMRLVSGGDRVDLVHMIGGGSMILPIAFFNIAFASLCQRIMAHPKWPQPIVYLTAGLCVLLFVIQIQVIGEWRRAGRETAHFQRDAAAWAEGHPGETLGVLPDWRSYGRAPLGLSESISWNTPFSRAVPHITLLAVEDRAAFDKAIEIEEWEPHRGVLRTKGHDAASLIGQLRAGPAALLRLEPAGTHEFRILIEPRGDALPRQLLPGIPGDNGRSKS